VQTALIALGLFAGAYALYGGLKAVALTDIVQVSLLVLGGLIISYIALNRISGGAGVIAGFHQLTMRFPEKFQMILAQEQPELQGPARPVGAAGRNVGDECLVLGLQPVHHSAGARRQEHPRSAEGYRARRVPEAAHARDHRICRASPPRLWCRTSPGRTRPIRI
jgi:hypothetical protein